MSVSHTFSQNIKLEGYAFESDNRGYLNLVKIEIFDRDDENLIAETFTNLEGFFEIYLPPGQFNLVARKSLFHPYTTTVSTAGKSEGEKVFAKIRLNRKPGYIFDVTIARVRDTSEEVTDAISGAWIEIYNNTIKEEIFNIKDYPYPNFQYTFEKGNHYTMLIRADNYFTKRLEAYVDVEGCILCFEGVGDIRPKVIDNLTQGHEMGTLLANIELQPADVGDKITLKNIFYDYNKWDIRDDAAMELDKLIQVLKDNPAIMIELSSHTDSRGKDEYNGELSFKRAKSAVNYLLSHDIEKRRIVPRGYGESQLVNECTNDVKCTDAQHQENRRTELKVIGVLSEDPLANKTLVEIKEEEQFAQMVRDLENQEIIEIKAGDELPDEIKKAINAASDLDSLDTDKEMNSENEMVNPDIEIETISDEVSQIQEDIQTEIEDTEIESADNSTINKIDPQFKYVGNHYSGFKVQLIVTSKSLETNNKLFDNHKMIYVDRSRDNFIYLLGDFSNREDAEKFLLTTIKKEFADAYIVQYANGIKK